MDEAEPHPERAADLKVPVFFSIQRDYLRKKKKKIEGRLQVPRSTPHTAPQVRQGAGLPGSPGPAVLAVPARRARVTGAATAYSQVPSHCVHSLPTAPRSPRGDPARGRGRAGRRGRRRGSLFTVASGGGKAVQAGDWGLSRPARVGGAPWGGGVLAVWKQVGRDSPARGSKAGVGASAPLPGRRGSQCGGRVTSQTPGCAAGDSASRRLRVPGAWGRGGGRVPGLGGAGARAQRRRRAGTGARPCAVCPAPCSERLPARVARVARVEARVGTRAPQSSASSRPA